MCKEKLKSYGNRIPETGLAIFCGVVRDGNQDSEVSYAVVPPTPIRNNSYHCDKEFHLEKLESLFATHPLYLYVVLTSSSAVILTLQGTRETVIHRFTVDMPTNSRKGGYSANRLARIRGEKRDLLEDKITEGVHQYLLGATGSVGHIFVGGSGPLAKTIYDALGTQGVPLSLHTISSEIHSRALHELLEQSHEVIHSTVITGERESLAYLEMCIARGGDRVVFGMERIVQADRDQLLEVVFLEKGFTMVEGINARCIVFEHITLGGYGKAVGLLYPGLNTLSLEDE